VDANVVLGVNFHEVYDAETHHIITMASCTTNCLAPVAKVLHEAVGIRHGQMTTVHAYTADQSLLDGPHKDLRRARAAAINLCRRARGSASGRARHPRAGGSPQRHRRARRRRRPARWSTSPSRPRRATSVEEVDAAFRAGADSGHLTGIRADSEAPIVSSDIVESPYSSIYDAPLMSVMHDTQVKVVSWYDNEWGYATRLVELAALVLEPSHVPLSAQGAAVV
jgi:glyceraldehyde 3-phosphate dehydrogenase